MKARNWTEYKRSELQAMSTEDLEGLYKSGCAYYSQLGTALAEMRAVNAARQEIATAEENLKAAKAKHATTAKGQVS